MKTVLEQLTEQMQIAWVQCGYEAEYGKVTVSNRPDLCQYQCNGALMAAKKYRKSPLDLAREVAFVLQENEYFATVEVAPPGFLNCNVSDAFLIEYLKTMARQEQYGLEKNKPKTVVLDYGGPNVAKPLHVGHLRSAVIGESLKRIRRYFGDHVIGDAHLGDWGLQIGLILTELKKRKPDLVYFDPEFSGEYPKEAPFTITELEEIYPYANAYAKTHEEFKEEAKEATYRLQNKEPGLLALWNHILRISIADLQENYKKLQVTFDLWKKESDAQAYIPDMIAKMKQDGYTRISEGALVVDVKEETDTKEIPPCMILKSDGATLYNTTDLATLVERMEQFHPDEVIYVVDKRQSLYFEQVFRCARKTKIVDEHTKLLFLGFGTMNGKDGKPFKTRDGGVMRLEMLLQNMQDCVYEKMAENKEIPKEEAKQIAQKIAVAAIKYGDLSNQASKDYVFDLQRFAAFEGNTGPYILYTIVRMRSILKKYQQREADAQIDIQNLESPSSESERALFLSLVKFQEVLQAAYEELAPHRICQFIYDVSNACNRFYHEHQILSETKQQQQRSWIALVALASDLLETCVTLLGIEVPEKM